MTGIGKIDNCQPTMAEGDPGSTIHPDSSAIRAAVMEACGHRFNGGQPERVGRMRGE
jgi:hypothetical protein